MAKVWKYSEMSECYEVRGIWLGVATALQGVIGLRRGTVIYGAT